MPNCKLAAPVRASVLLCLLNIASLAHAGTTLSEPLHFGPSGRLEDLITLDFVDMKKQQALMHRQD